MQEGLRNNVPRTVVQTIFQKSRHTLLALSILLQPTIAQARDLDTSAVLAHMNAKESLNSAKAFMGSFGSTGPEAKTLSQLMTKEKALEIVAALTRAGKEISQLQSKDSSPVLPPQVRSVPLSEQGRHAWETARKLPAPVAESTEYTFSLNGVAYVAGAAHAFPHGSSQHFIPEGFDIALRRAKQDEAQHAVPVSNVTNTVGAELFSMYGASSTGRPYRIQAPKIPSLHILQALKIATKNGMVKLDTGALVSLDRVSIFPLSSDLLKITKSGVPEIKGVSGGFACKILSGGVTPACTLDANGNTILSGQLIGYIAVPDTDYVLGLIQDGSAVIEAVKMFESQASSATRKTAGL